VDPASAFLSRARVCRRAVAWGAAGSGARRLRSRRAETRALERPLPVGPRL